MVRLVDDRDMSPVLLCMKLCRICVFVLMSNTIGSDILFCCTQSLILVSACTSAGVVISKLRVGRCSRGQSMWYKFSSCTTSSAPGDRIGPGGGSVALFSVLESMLSIHSIKSSIPGRSFGGDLAGSKAVDTSFKNMAAAEKTDFEVCDPELGVVLVIAVPDPDPAVC